MQAFIHLTYYHFEVEELNKKQDLFECASKDALLNPYDASGVFIISPTQHRNTSTYVWRKILNHEWK